MTSLVKLDKSNKVCYNIPITMKGYGYFYGIKGFDKYK